MSYNRWKLFERDGFRCRYCGAHASEAKLHVDHVQPRSKGGTDDPLNLVTACAACNLSKRDHAPRWLPCTPTWPDQWLDAPNLDNPFEAAWQIFEDSPEIDHATFVTMVRFQCSYWGRAGLGNWLCNESWIGWDDARQSCRNNVEACS